MRDGETGTEDSTRESTQPFAEPSREGGSIGDLVAAAARGDAAATAELYRRYRGYLASAVVPRIPSDLASRVDVDDLLQSAFLSAFVALPQHRFVDEPRFRGWLREIALNKLRDRLRSLVREGDKSAEIAPDVEHDLLDALGRAEETPSAILARAETQARLSEALDELDPYDRRLIQMRCFEHRTWPDIADSVGTSDDSARRHYQEAIEALWKRLR